MNLRNNRTCQAIVIRRSYRNRGYEERMNTTTQQTKTVDRKINTKFDIKFIRKILVSIDRNMMLPYSDKKIIAKPPLLYSVLNPDTSSDSPSAKSKGARLVSATNKHIQHKNHIGFVRTKNQVL